MVRNILSFLVIALLAGCSSDKPAAGQADRPSPGPLRYVNEGPNDEPPRPAPTPWIKYPLRLASGSDGIPHVGRVKGRPFVETRGGGGSAYLYFRVDNEYAFDIDETVLVHVVYDSSVAGRLRLQYDSHSPPPDGSRYNPCEDVAAEGKLRWAKHTFTLHRARFADRMDNGSDIRIMSPDGRVRLADITIERPNAPKEAKKGTLKLRFVDGKTGETTPCRLGLYADGKRLVYPGDQAAPIWMFYRESRVARVWQDFSWPVENNMVFYSAGELRKDIPAGEYTLVARKGIEYRIVDERLAVKAGETLDRVVRLERWIDMPAKGWYSGDGHVHVGRTEARNEPIRTMTSAEDIHLANIVRMGDIRDLHFPQYAFGPSGRFGAGDHVICSGHEDPRTQHRGHALLYNVKRPVRDDDTYFLYHRAFEEARRQGGLVGYAHAGIDFNAERGMAVDMPFHLVDLLEILQLNKLRTRVYYEWLNLGYRLIPIAGSDFPYGDIPGGVRVYAHLDEKFSAQAWFRGLASGKVFVTNGPILTLSVDGRPMGAEIRAKKGHKLTIEATARMNPDIDKLLALELVVHGDVLKTASGDGGDLSLSHEIRVDRSTWVAVRAHGKSAQSHSAPVYVVVEGRRSWNLLGVPESVARQRKHMKEMINTEPKPEHEMWLAPVVKKKWHEQRPMLRRRISEADAKYDELMMIYEREKK